MIGTMNIKNIGIIGDLTVEFGEGFNVLTGETGAGKTLIIDSLGIISGNRFSKEMIRKGESQSFVELNLFLPQIDTFEDNNVVVSREIYESGRNVCKINGRLVTVNELREFMENIIDIHGQNDSQTLMNKQQHIQYLDNFIGDEILELKSKYLREYNEYVKIEKELKNNYGDEKEKSRRIDLLNYQLKEINDADLKIGEEEKLAEAHSLMKNSEKIYNNLIEAEQDLGYTTVDAINNAIKCFERIDNLGDKYKEKLIELKNIYYEIQELSRDITALKEELIFDESEQNEVEERLNLIYSLKRKYGNTIKEIIEYKNNVENELLLIENSEERSKELKKRQDILKQDMKEICILMNQIRLKKSKVLSKEIDNELVELEMPNAHFMVSIEFDENGKFTQNGLDNIEFLISTNVGNDFKPLVKIASGGEISRIMLAIKTVFADSDKIPVLVFDEIDTGISGKASKAVGEKLKLISQKHQVLCVTHQPNIAAKGDHNYYISKSVEKGKTLTNIKKLNEQETINEIARIASGDITISSIEHAKELRLAI